MSKKKIQTEVVVIGGGPGGYNAAFRAADLGKETVLVDERDVLGGVCLNVGCIPSKALLHAAESLYEFPELKDWGIHYPAPKIDLSRVREKKNKIIQTLNKGLAGMAKMRKVRTIRGFASFEGSKTLSVQTEDGPISLEFQQAVIAVGSRPVRLPGFPHDDERLLDSTGALSLSEIPRKFLIIGGGIIGLEMAQVYHAFGSEITVVELMDQIIPPADKEMTQPLLRRIRGRYKNIHLKTKVSRIEALSSGLKVFFEGEAGAQEEVFDKVLVSVGRRPNGDLLQAEKAGIRVDERGFIPTDLQKRTNIPHIFAIGDVTGQPMLAHKASHEAKVAAEVIAGEKTAFTPAGIPSVAYTDPELAWAGLTEKEAQKQGIEYEKAVFPWAANGRAHSMERTEGITKILFRKDNRRLIGGAVSGVNAGEMIAEIMLGIEMGADIEDLSLTIHPHPTLAETIGLAAEVAEGSVTEIYLPKR